VSRHVVVRHHMALFGDDNAAAGRLVLDLSSLLVFRAHDLDSHQGRLHASHRALDLAPQRRRHIRPLNGRCRHIPALNGGNRYIPALNRRSRIIPPLKGGRGDVLCPHTHACAQAQNDNRNQYGKQMGTHALRPHFVLSGRCYHTPTPATTPLYCDVEGPFFEADRYGRVTHTRLFSELEAILRQARPVLLVIDPLSAAAAIADENSNAQVGIVAAELATLARKLDIVLLLVHHTGKAAAGAPGSQHAARGASALACRSRWIMQLSPRGSEQDGQPLLETRIVKDSYHVPHQPVVLERCHGGALRTVESRKPSNGDNGDNGITG